MFAEYFKNSPALIFPIISLLIFVTVFTGVVFLALSRRGKDLAAAAERLPLIDDDLHPHAPATGRGGVDVQEDSHE